jgi:hypothetical protein
VAYVPISENRSHGAALGNMLRPFATARDSATSSADRAARKLVPVLKAEGPEVAAWPVTLDLQPGWA